MRPEWSRMVDATDANGVQRTWHLLDSWNGRPPSDTPASLTLLCVHGNPSWSFLWRSVLADAPSHIRVLAVDHLGMGFSERCGTKRNLATRIDDLCSLTKALNVTGPVATLAHDWGGPISLGWALRHLPSPTPDTHPKAWLTAVVLTNTAVHQPESASFPAVIRLLRAPGLLNTMTVNTRTFIKGAINMSHPPLTADVQAGFFAPYEQAQRRSGIADFVADIPLTDHHESAQTLNEIAGGLSQLADIPTLLLWGPRDKVFSDVYLHDLERRLPHADVHRFPKAAHFVSEDADVSGAVHAWLAEASRNESARESALSSSPENSTDTPPRRALASFSAADANARAVVELPPSDHSITFGELEKQVEQLASGMAAFGIQPGDRVAVMIMPGVDLALSVYACWRLGAALVLVDSGLGRQGMQAALRSANPDYLIGIDKALIAARLLGWPGRRIAVAKRSATLVKSLGIISDLETLITLGQGLPVPAWPDEACVAIVAFTSGSTGPSKGVVYQHSQVQAQRDALMQLYSIVESDRLVAAFAPFALYGPTMCITCVVPTMDVKRPSTLSAGALADAVASIKATLVFASPAALVNVVATQGNLSAEKRAAFDTVRLTLSAGAPVRSQLLQAAKAVFTSAQFHTPYGMTEVLPVANISLDELVQLERDAPLDSAGVCVGFPVDGVHISIDPLDEQGEPIGKPGEQVGVLGEIVVRAAHCRHGYDRLWFTQHKASLPIGSHRSGDIGQLDEEGRLWIGGRLGHVMCSSDGVIAPVAAEQLIESLPEVHAAAVVGVGPKGVQVVVAVVQMQDAGSVARVTPLDLIDRVRASVALPVGTEIDIAAVLVAKQLPVDKRHNSKIDRTAVAQWASRVLAGEKAGPL